MIPARLTAALAISLTLGLAQAAPAAASGKDKGDKAKAAGAGEGFDLAPVAVPVVVAGQVRNYVFVTFRIVPAPGADESALRKKEPFLRDAVVRLSHHTPFTRPDNHNLIDETRACAALLGAAPALVGKGQVKAVKVTLQSPKNLRRAPTAR